MFRFWLSRALHYLAGLVEGTGGWTEAYSRLNFSDGPQVYVWKFKMDRIKDTDSYRITEVSDSAYIVQTNGANSIREFETTCRIKHVQDASELIPYLDEKKYSIRSNAYPLRSTDWMTLDESIEEQSFMLEQAFQDPDNVIIGKSYIVTDEVSV